MKGLALALAVVAAALAAQAAGGAGAACGTAEAVVRDFVSALDAPDPSRIDALLAPEERFAWFVANGPTAFYAFSRDGVAGWAVRHRAAGERLAVRSLALGTPGPRRVGFVYSLVRTAPGRAPVTLTGKGSVDCEGDAPRVAVWAMGAPVPPVEPAPGLRRPLRLPRLEPGSDCPRSDGRPASTLSPDFGSALAIGPNPVRLVVSTRVEVEGTPGTARTAAVPASRQLNVLWIEGPMYRGAALVRGAALRGTNAPSPRERLLFDGARGRGWLAQASSLRFPAPGCYGLQVDGRTFSNVILVEAV